MATYYWRGGSGTWDVSSTTNWSNTSGGAGGFGPPTDVDTVIFDSASSGASYTVQCGIGSVCARITATAPATGNITFSNTVENFGILMYCGSPTGALTTTINIYNGAIFTAGSNGAEISLFCYAAGTSTITFNNSGAATQPINIGIRQGSNSAYSNTVNFCNGHTQTFASVLIVGGYSSGYVTSTTYNTFNCTTATISIIGGSYGYEFFDFGGQFTDYPSILQLEFAGNIVLTNTSITIGAAATLSTASYGGVFSINAVSGGTLSCSGTSISILRVPTIQTTFTFYFYIATAYTCSTQLANVTLSNGMPAAPGYSASFGNVPGLSGNLIVRNTVSNAAGLYLSISPYINKNFTIAGTTTITAAYLYYFFSANYSVTHTGAVSLIGSALGMCTYAGGTTAAITFNSTLTSTNPTSFSGSHTITFNNSTINVAGNVNLVDTYIIANNLTSTGFTNTWTHGYVNGGGNGANIYNAISLTTGLTTLTNAGYINSNVATFSFAALTLSGSQLYTYGAITTTGNVILSSYSSTGLSTIVSGYGGGFGGISITGIGTLTSTNTGNVNSVHVIETNTGNLSVSSTINLTDARLYINNGTVSCGSFTHSNVVANAVSANSLVGLTFTATVGAISLTKVNYTFQNTVTANSGASAITVSGSNINFQGIVASTLTLTNSSTTYSTVDVYTLPTIASLTSTSSSTGVHAIRFLASGLTTTGAISLADTQITVAGAVSCSIYSHTNNAAAAIALTNSVSSLTTTGAGFTTGAISIIRAVYSLAGNVLTSGTVPSLYLALANFQTGSNVYVAALTLQGATLNVGTYLTATDVTVTYSGTTYSTLTASNAVNITSLTSSSSSTGAHNISFGDSLTSSSSIDLVDTQITVTGAVSVTSYYFHTNASAAAIAFSNTIGGSLNVGLFSLTKATYAVSSSVSSGASGTSLIGSSLTVGSTLGAAAVGLANSVNVYSTLAVTGATSIASLTSTSTGTGSHTANFLGAFSTTGAVSLVDTTFRAESTTSVGTTWTQTKTATGTARSSNLFNGNTTFGGNTAFTNSDVVFAGQTNSVTGTFSFTVTSATNVVSEGFYPTNDNPAITFLYDGASTFGVSSSFTITGATTNRTNVRTFVPYINTQPLNLRYFQVTISVASVSLSYVNFQNVTASGATPWTGTALGNATGNNNITFPVAATCFLVASSGTVQSNTAIWATSSGGATSINNYPLPQDTIVVDNNSASVGAVVVNFASIVYATNVIGQASINRSVTFSRADRSSLILLGNITLFTPAAGGLVFDKLNITLTNASAASAHILSWPTGYAPIANSNTVQLNLYSLGSMTLSGSTSSSAYLQTMENAIATPTSGSYGTFTISDGVETYVNSVQIANTTANSSNFTSSTIYTPTFTVAAAATTAYTLSASPATFSAILSTVSTNYVGTLNLVTSPLASANVNVPSIGTLNISIYTPINVSSYMYIASCTVGNMTGGGTNASNQIYLYGFGGGPGTITKSGGGFVQLNYVRPGNLSAAPANTFYATNSSLAPGGTATGWTFTAAPTATAGGNFFLEF